MQQTEPSVTSHPVDLTSREYRFPKVFCALIWVLVVLSGCGRQKEKVGLVGDAGNELEVIPSELFVGELKRLEPHLGLNAGCIKLKGTGAGQKLKVGLQRWKNGKLAGSLLSFDTICADDSEISISAKSVSTTDGHTSYEVTIAVLKPGETKAHHVKADGLTHKDDKGVKTTTVVLLSENAKIPVNGSVAIWGIGAEGKSDGTLIEAVIEKETVEKMASKSEWALVLTVGRADKTIEEKK